MAHALLNVELNHHEHFVVRLGSLYSATGIDWQKHGREVRHFGRFVSSSGKCRVPIGKVLEESVSYLSKVILNLIIGNSEIEAQLLW